MKGFLNFSENTFAKEPEAGIVDQIMYGIWCHPNCECGCFNPFSVGMPEMITPDYGIWPPPGWPPVDCK